VVVSVIATRWTGIGGEKEVEYRGHVKWFSDGKGWGFVTGNDGRDNFVHQREVLSGGERLLREGEPVVFELEKKGGRFRAVYVRRVSKEVF
jgi:CspA family cold shock protein